MTLIINDEEEFTGTEMECMDYANESYFLTDEQYSSLQYDGEVVINGVSILLSED